MVIIAKACQEGAEFTQTIDPCSCMVLSQRNSACVAGVHTPAKPVVCGRHVVGT